ncbi:hypothetical protein P7C70_g2586, partial [Phenoliferia sp. Uapishka_3]
MSSRYQYDATHQTIPLHLFPPFKPSSPSPSSSRPGRASPIPSSYTSSSSRPGRASPSPGNYSSTQSRPSRAIPSPIHTKNPAGPRPPPSFLAAGPRSAPLLPSFAVHRQLPDPIAMGIRGPATPDLASFSISKPSHSSSAHPRPSAPAYRPPAPRTSYMEASPGRSSSMERDASQRRPLPSNSNNYPAGTHSGYASGVAASSRAPAPPSLRQPPAASAARSGYPRSASPLPPRQSSPTPSRDPRYQSYASHPPTSQNHSFSQLSGYASSKTSTVAPSPRSSSPFQSSQSRPSSPSPLYSRSNTPVQRSHTPLSPMAPARANNRRVFAEVDQSPVNSRRNSPVRPATDEIYNLHSSGYSNPQPAGRNVRPRAMSLTSSSAPRFAPLPGHGLPRGSPAASSHPHPAFGGNPKYGYSDHRSAVGSSSGSGSEGDDGEYRPAGSSRSRKKPVAAYTGAEMSRTVDYQRRKSFSNPELRVLTAAWNAGHYYPASSLVESICQATNLTRPQVRGWFALSSKSFSAMHLTRLRPTGLPTGGREPLNMRSF